jgi:hypothetical protein
VVAVHVCYEDLCYPVEAGFGDEHLSLDAFAAVEHQLLAFALQ